MARYTLMFNLEAEGGPEPGPLTLSNDTFQVDLTLDDESELKLKYFLEPSLYDGFLRLQSYDLGVTIASSQRRVIFRTILKIVISSDCYPSNCPLEDICREDMIIDQDAYREQIIWDSIFTYNKFFPTPSTSEAPRCGKANMVFQIDVFMSTFLNEPLTFYGAGSGRLRRSSYKQKVTLAQNLTKFHYYGENYSDLKLKSRDNMIIKAHKMILAARSPYLKNLLESEVAHEELSGTLEIDDVDGKPLISVLHWIYSENIPEGCGRYIEDIAEAAVLFELEDLLHLLDKTMSKYCHPENMFKLLRVAEKYSMKIAMTHISAYITMNINPLVGIISYPDNQTEHAKKMQEALPRMNIFGWQINEMMFFKKLYFFIKLCVCFVMPTVLFVSELSKLE